MGEPARRKYPNPITAPSAQAETVASAAPRIPRFIGPMKSRSSTMLRTPTAAATASPALGRAATVKKVWKTKLRRKSPVPQRRPPWYSSASAICSAVMPSSPQTLGSTASTTPPRMAPPARFVDAAVAKASNAPLRSRAPKRLAATAPHPAATMTPTAIMADVIGKVIETAESPVMPTKRATNTPSATR